MLNLFKNNFIHSLALIIARIKKVKRLSLIEATNKKFNKVLKVSIILPVLNSETTLSKAIKSIQNQEYPEWELLIIDDGSIDRTLEISKEFIATDSRIKLYKNHNNKGVAYSRNVGLHYANGDYITFHDADDTSHPERLDYQLFYLLSKPSCKVTVPLNFRVNDKNEPYIINGKLKWNRVSGMMFAKELIDEIGYFKPTHISEDSEYHERILAFYGKRSRKIIRKVLYYALFSPDSLLFSNANVKVHGNKVNYKINDKEAAVLEGYRKEHKEIKAGNLSPYQGFEIDTNITMVIKE